MKTCRIEFFIVSLLCKKIQIMNKILLGVALALFGMTFIKSCTDNERARRFGGTETIELEKNQVVVGTSWKENQLWILTKDTITKEYIYQEKSSWGIIEGQIKFKSKN